MDLDFNEKKTINIGICWKGNPKNIRDKERSIELKLFEHLFKKKMLNFLFYKKIFQMKKGEL